MKRWLNILIISLFILLNCFSIKAQKNNNSTSYLVPVCVYKGDTIPWIQLPQVYIFKPLKFKNDKEKRNYYRLVYNIKKTLPISKEINKAIIETYEYIETLPNEKAKQKHIKRVEKGLKEQYTARMKKLSFKQGKLLIKLIDRQSNQTSYEIVKAFMGPFKAGLYQAFAGLFGASLRKQYDPQGKDKLIERVVLLVESGQI
ncbi:DUF4294 domain-containing protein [uncultured Bacteroides sp.]|uniref:DUF4294 domain-containing protein n=1 Tax=uncultured Bacteroides sp. TaxID=162156 RepID=UPI002AAB0218|nr:DUF4294 domain-containing protein [uncultured Bacteroides sp.]